MNIILNYFGLEFTTYENIYIYKNLHEILYKEVTHLRPLS